MTRVKQIGLAALFLGAAVLSGTPAHGAGIKGSAELECQVDWPDSDYLASGVAKISGVKSCYNCYPGGTLYRGTISVQCHDLTPGETYIVYPGGGSFTASGRGTGGVASEIGWVGEIGGIGVDVFRSDGEWVLSGVIVLKHGH